MISYFLFFICALLIQFNDGTWTASINPIKFSNITLSYLLDNGGYAIVSAGKNPASSSSEFHLTDEFIEQRSRNLSNDITKTYLYSNVLGKYDGALEDSFLVVLHNTCPDEERDIIFRLGEKYNQDSVIYVRRAQPVIQQLIYTTGPLNGTYVEGEGYTILSTNTTDNFSRVQLCPNEAFTFTLNFNFKTQQFIEHHTQNKILNRLHHRL